MPAAAINRFLLENGFSILTNPCVSPDFCLDWDRCHALLRDGGGRCFEASRLALPAGVLTLWEDPASGDHAWRLEPAGEDAPGFLAGGRALPGGAWLYPATFANLLVLKNRIQEADPGSTVFPGTGGNLARGTIGVGARMTTLHWPAVEWAMAALGLGLTANQNSIPRELVYDVDAMLAGRLDSVPFPFIGCDVPEGHQGQSVEGMSHGCILSKLATGFHRRRIPWSFNADHQPVGGKYDAREDRLVEGCLLASYITFDLSPELAVTTLPADPAARAAWVAAEVPQAVRAAVGGRLAAAGLEVGGGELDELLCRTWPALRKMQLRDQKYAAIRARHFSTPAGRAYLRELSIDELPGLTTPATTAVMLACCEALGMPVQFIAPAFGFQKNCPYPDNQRLRELVEAQWQVCQRFGVSIGFHSGSGKSAENYRIMGGITGGRLEIKTSGRYTYEFARALAASDDPGDRALWLDWHAFTRRLAVAGAYAADPVERAAARSFVLAALPGHPDPEAVFAAEGALTAALAALPPSPDHMFFFEYNFLFLLAAGGSAAKQHLGDHGPGGYRQRARFYAVSPQTRLRFAKNIAAYLIFLCRETGLAGPEAAAAAAARLDRFAALGDLLGDIAPA
jgi:hypothetical protein